MKKLEDIKQEFQEIIAKRDNDLEETTKLYESIDEKIKMLRNNLVEAEENNNYQVYDKLKQELWTSENMFELLNKTIHKLLNEPAISKEEFKKYAKLIQKVSNESQRKLVPKANEVIAELEEIKNDSNSVINLTDELLEELAYDICKMDKFNIRHPYNTNDSGSYDLSNLKHAHTFQVAGVIEQNIYPIKRHINEIY